MSQLIERGVRVLRRHWKALVAGAALIATVGLVIAEATGAHFNDVLSSMVTVDPVQGPVFSASDADLQRLAYAAALSIGGSLIAAACLTVVAVVAAQYVDRDYHGGTITLRAAVGTALRRAPVAVTAWLLTMLAVIALIVAAVVAALALTTIFPADASGGGIGALLALIVAVAVLVVVVTLGVRWSVAPAVVALEPVGPVHALRRSWHLSGNNTWRAFGLQLLVVFVVSIIAAVLTEIINALVLVPVSDNQPLQFSLQVALSVVVGLLTAPILPVMLTALYFDLRVRRDRPEPSLPPQSWRP